MRKNFFNKNEPPKFFTRIRNKLPTRIVFLSIFLMSQDWFYAIIFMTLERMNLTGYKSHFIVKKASRQKIINEL